MNAALTTRVQKRPEQGRARPVNWEAIDLMVARMNESTLKKRIVASRIKKTLRLHGIGALDQHLRYNYVCARLELGDFSDYFGWEYRGFGDEKDDTGWAAELYWMETWLPKWGGGYVDRLLVLGEQGVGDVIFFASILPEAMTRCKTVVYECDARLHTLLERSLPGLVCDQEYPFEERRPGDAFIPAAELMRMFRRDPKHFPGKPYLRPDPARVAEFEAFRGRDGVAWLGRQGTIDPMDLGLAHPVSLQYKETHIGIEQPPVDLWNDIEGIVALCSVLGRVVTVPTSVHHFAGALGKRVEIIRPAGGGVDNPLKWDYALGKSFFYPNVEVFASIDRWKAAHAPKLKPRSMCDCNQGRLPCTCEASRGFA